MDLSKYIRRKSSQVQIGETLIGGDNPVAVQSMTNTATADTAASVAQIKRIADAGAPIVRLTAQGRKEGENLENIMRELRADGYRTALVADIHFSHKLAVLAIENGANKVRINPGNIGGEREIAYVADCIKRHQIPLKII